MKNERGNLLATIGFLVCFCINGLSHGATMIGLWQLDNDLTNELPGSALTATGWSPTYSSVIIGGVPSDVLDVPALTSAQLLTFANPIGVNGNGTTRTNDFSVGWDVNFRTLQSFESLLQTDPANSNDVDVYATSAGRIQTSGGAGTPTSTFAADTWYRIVMTSLNDGAGTTNAKFYVNGIQLSSAVSFSTDPVVALSALANNHIFTDESGETGDAYLNSFALWDGALSDAEVLAFGGPSSIGFAVPEPGIPSLLLIGLAGAMQRRRRVAA